MNNQNNQISDEQLDEWLATVEMPTELHGELLKIPSEEPTVERVAKTESYANWKLAAAIAVAACYLILAGGIWLFWPAAPQKNNLAKDGDISSKRKSQADRKELRNGGSPIRVESSPRWLELTVADKNETLQSIEEKLNDLKILELEEKLAKAESQFQLLESRETASIVLAIADQTPLNFGASQESINSDMTRVIAEYPDSRGAKIASQFVQHPNW